MSETREMSVVTKKLLRVLWTLRTGGCEAVAALGEDLHQVVGQVTASQVQTEDGMGQGVTCGTQTASRYSKTLRTVPLLQRITHQ